MLLILFYFLFLNIFSKKIGHVKYSMAMLIAEVLWQLLLIFETSFVFL